MKAGDMVEFVWWSMYLAPGLISDDMGRTVWHELSPGDRGIVVRAAEEDYIVALFTTMDALVKVHFSMLQIIE